MTTAEYRMLRRRIRLICETELPATLYEIFIVHNEKDGLTDKQITSIENTIKNAVKKYPYVKALVVKSTTKGWDARRIKVKTAGRYSNKVVGTKVAPHVHIPDIINCEALANLYDVSLNDLVKHDSKQEGYPLGPKDKHLFGIATIGERGQIVLPKKARDMMKLQTGDSLVVLGDTNPVTPGIALVKEDVFLRMTGGAADGLFKSKGEE